MSDPIDSTIRPAIAADAAAIASLIAEMARSLGEVSEMRADYPRTFLAHPDTGVLLAERDGVAVGMLAYSIRPNLFHGGPAGVIEELVVDADYRRQGIGTGLLRRALQLFEAERCVEVSLTTDLDNVRAQSVYRRVGLTEKALELRRFPARRAKERPRPLS